MPFICGLRETYVLQLCSKVKCSIFVCLSQSSIQFTVYDHQWQCGHRLGVWSDIYSSAHSSTRITSEYELNSVSQWTAMRIKVARRPGHRQATVTCRLWRWYQDEHYGGGILTDIALCKTLRRWSSRSSRCRNGLGK